MSNETSTGRSGPLSKRRYAAYLAVTILFPFALLGLVELGLRAANPDGGLPLFEKAPFVRGDYLVASGTVGKRWFGGIRNAPAPPPEPFALIKPGSAMRVFVLGESTTAGFPYPRNVTFSRLLRDMLVDALPGVTVEVVNLGIAASNSFAMLDMAPEILEHRPDAVIIYAGHNEYYGALGAASRVGFPGGTGAVRAYLKLLRLRTVLAARDGLAALRGGAAAGDADIEATSLMEVLARDREVPFGSERYAAGVRQYEGNLEAVVRSFRSRGVPVFVGSLVSNLRDQPPFAAASNGRTGGAVAAFDSGRAALSTGNHKDAARLFARARDLDVVRFRAPTEFNDVIRRVATSAGATYVPVAEAFASRSQAGIVGSELLLEHVHPNREGYALMGRVFFEAMAASGLLGRKGTPPPRPWSAYFGGTALTPIDDRIAHHTVRTLASRWPFVKVARQTDYRGTYVPVDLLDSLAFDVSRGAPWAPAKLRLASAYEGRGRFDSAAAEYAGLARDSPLFDEPLLLLARASALAGDEAAAEAALMRAVAIRPTAAALAMLGTSAAKRRDLSAAISFFNRSLALQPNQPELLYQLSLTYGMVNDVTNARASAARLSQLNPSYPGLGAWLERLGLPQMREPPS